jgi:hypothetical protein
MNKSTSSLSRFPSIALLFAFLCLSTAFYACGVTKEEMARKEAIEKTERMTTPTPVSTSGIPVSTPVPARLARPRTAKAEMKADTMR